MKHIEDTTNNEKNHLTEQIYEFLHKGAVSCVEIEDKFGRGEYIFELKTNTILWPTFRMDVINGLLELHRTKKIIIYPSQMLVYMLDGCVPQLPIAKSDRNYKFARWLPVVLWRTDVLKRIKLLKPKEAKIYRAAGWDV